MPFLVAQEAGSIYEYTHCNCFRPHADYRFSMESTIYLDKDVCGKGYGCQLLNALVYEAELASVRKMIAYIAGSANERFLRLHRAAGFSHVDVLKSCAWKLNGWIDSIFMEKKT
ncbi:unnamed protein product [Rotaria sp. Silwood1]|nr:unnamed protein product [Rotaria sp. Silwood1]CAF3735643.1 unnamed protein product [Rotaria sp. Silwood1]CAF3833147.1 unnamed protein product [Rotaria sp. Silwood1]CAF4720561.1 unnamed protein product [Rotaria sp. Silwood1]CAF4833271.1 unnamed protein product [Rotaria sp. Silwood1]